MIKLTDAQTNRMFWVSPSQIVSVSECAGENEGKANLITMNPINGYFNFIVNESPECIVKRLLDYKMCMKQHAVYLLHEHITGNYEMSKKSQRKIAELAGLESEEDA